MTDQTTTHWVMVVYIGPFEAKPLNCMFNAHSSKEKHIWSSLFKEILYYGSLDLDSHFLRS